MPTTEKQPLSIIVSGGSRGLGQSIVSGLIDSGHRVATFSRSRTPFIESLSGHERFTYHSADATDTKALVEFVSNFQSASGRVDALINNAGVAYDGVLALTSESDIAKMLDINLKASIVLAKECVRYMLGQNSGNIINISSLIAQRGFTGLSAYAATKAGMIGFTKSLAREVGGRGIRVNAIAPGYLETDMSEELTDRQREQIRRRTPLGRLGTSDDVVPVVEFLLSPASQFITGQVITVDGGAGI